MHTLSKQTKSMAFSLQANYTDRSFRAADCDTDHYLVVAEIRKRLPVNKQGLHTFIWRGSMK
jgi:hypothetical protein